jgi:hypothetical protein
MDQHQLHQGTRYDFVIRDADGRQTTTYSDVAFAGYGRWLPEDESQPEFVVVVVEDEMMPGGQYHHVWNMDRIVVVGESETKPIP